MKENTEGRQCNGTGTCCRKWRKEIWRENETIDRHTTGYMGHGWNQFNSPNALTLKNSWKSYYIHNKAGWAWAVMFNNQYFAWFRVPPNLRITDLPCLIRTDLRTHVTQPLIQTVDRRILPKMIGQVTQVHLPFRHTGHMIELVGGIKVWIVVSGRGSSTKCNHLTLLVSYNPKNYLKCHKQTKCYDQKM